MEGHDCPITAASKVLARKWSLVIVYHLLDGEKGFAELEKSIKAISSKTLSETLEDLRKLGVVERIIEPGPPVRVRYRLTDMGRDLRGVILELAKWSCKWVSPSRHCNDIIDKIAPTARLDEPQKSLTLQHTRQIE
ncbi:winged helix-turn-helix transcriptional regulator [Aeropyrum camini]|uniref:HxlR family transcriptional regulator n=1 Tax=Aeropyrum camini SY1 = JCM 12091 TaxID=1198449 RepID=U3TI72_9CREN|nr:helix-turn-helix domain-containing protein [Aeropyrum camini]BAN91054.1 HxlR family transcriptional regulator [Aeropyrum camini SY1 = JCM 12091]